MMGCPRRCGWCACSTDAKNASMSTSMIMRATSAGPGPGPRQHPRRAPRVVAELVAVVPGALDGEVAEHGLALPPRPLTGHPAHADDPPLPAEADGAHGTVHERGQHVDGVVQGFEHVGSRLAPLLTLLHGWAVGQEGSVTWDCAAHSSTWPRRRADKPLSQPVAGFEVPAFGAHLCGLAARN